MKKIKSTRVFLVFAFFFIICTAGVDWFERSATSVVEAKREISLTLEITTPQRKYIKAEPIPLTFKVSNPTELAISWGGFLDFGKDINLLIRAPNGTDIQWKGDEHDFSMSDAGPRLTQPGKSNEVDRLIDEDFAQRLFSQTGRYQLRVEFVHMDLVFGQRERKTSLSNTITFDIEEPRGRDLAAYNYFKNALEPAIHGNNRNDELIARQYFTNNFADSVYWKYNAYELGNVYMELGQNENAENEFFKISDVDFYYSKNVPGKLGELAGKLSRPTPRSKRPPDHTNDPVARPIASPNISLVPVPPIHGRIIVPSPTP